MNGTQRVAVFIAGFSLVVGLIESWMHGVSLVTGLLLGGVILMAFANLIILVVWAIGGPSEVRRVREGLSEGF